MPGPAKWRTTALVGNSLATRRLTQRLVDERAVTILRWAQRCAKLSPEVVYGPDKEVTVDRAEDRKLLRKVAAKSVVLLKNDNQALPLSSWVKRIAVIGPRAEATSVFGGGSAQLNTRYVVTVLDGMKESRVIESAIGCIGELKPQTIADFQVTDICHISRQSNDPAATTGARCSCMPQWMI